MGRVWVPTAPPQKRPAGARVDAAALADAEADRRGEELVVVGGTRVRAEYYAGIRSALPEGDLTDARELQIRDRADRGEIDAILLLDCLRDDPWLQDLVVRAVAAWGPHEERRFTEGEHAATLYLRPPPGGP